MSITFETPFMMSNPV